MYQNLTTSELKALLSDRQIAGRSKATTKASMIALLESFDIEAGKLAAPIPAPQPQPKAAPVQKPAQAPTPIRPKSTPSTPAAAEVVQEAESFPSQSLLRTGGEMVHGSDVAKAMAEAVAKAVSEALNQALARISAPPAPESVPAFPPEGPWLNEAGELRPDFIDWIAAQWKASFPNRATQSDWQIRSDVFKHLEKPGKLLPAWVSFENDCKERAQKEAISREAGISSKALSPHPLSGLEVVGSISTEDEYGNIQFFPVEQVTAAEYQKLEEARRIREANRRALPPVEFMPFPHARCLEEFQQNLKVLTNKFTLNPKPKGNQFSAKHYQDVARSYRARYAVVRDRADEEEF